MNLFKGKLNREQGGLAFRNVDFSMSLGELPVYPEGPIAEVGMRPEDIEIGRGPRIVFEAQLETFSNLGAHKYIHARVEGTLVTGRAPKEASHQPGYAITLAIFACRLS